MFPFWSFYTEQFSILTGLNVPSSAFKLSSRMCLCIINVHLRNEQSNNASCWCSFAKSLMTIFPSTYCNSHFYSCTTQCSAPCLWVLQKIATRLPTWTTANHRFVVSLWVIQINLLKLFFMVVNFYLTQLFFSGYALIIWLSITRVFVYRHACEELVYVCTCAACWNML